MPKTVAKTPARTDTTPHGVAEHLPAGLSRERMTKRQGQYLAFIYYYAKINRRPPAEADIQRYFQVSAPTVHQMVLTLEAGGLLERTPGQARSLRGLLPPDQLPLLE